jgi:hypothetical protein
MKTRSVRRAFAIACFGLTLALGSAPAFADVPISENARVHFKAGVNLLQDPGGARYEDAYREFKAAYADSPSPRILGNMALCLMKLERDGEAIKAYEAYLAGVPDMSPDERRQTVTDLGTLKAGAAHVTLKLAPATVAVTDVRVPVTGGIVTNVYAAPAGGPLELAVRPGHHAMTVKGDGLVPQTFEFEATPGGKFEREVTLEKPREQGPVGENPPPRQQPTGPTTRPISTAVYVAGISSLALAAGGVVVGSLALKQQSDFNAANNGTDPNHAASLRSTGLAFNVLTDILFVGAIAGGGITTYLYVSRPSVESEPAAAPVARSKPLKSLAVTVAPNGASLAGSF